MEYHHFLWLKRKTILLGNLENLLSFKRECFEVPKGIGVPEGFIEHSTF
jgi:hypothetical protein